MRTRDPRRLRRLATGLVAILALVALRSGSAQASEDSHASANAAREEQGAELQALVDADQALGVYWDEAKGEYSLVVSSVRGDGRSVTPPSGPARVRLETSQLDRDAIDRIEDSIFSKRADLKDYSLGYGFDPESGTVLLRSDAPQSAFAQILEAYPGMITFRQAKFELASSSNDPQPHSGGASLNGTLNCTSGFTFKFNSTGKRYMVTAGHCNPHGTSTNMGTVWRDSQVYPHWHFELVHGHSYQGRIYDSANFTRPVVNAQNPAVGASYCTRGRTTGTVCGYIVRKLNQTICYPNYPGCAHNLVEFYRSDETIPQPGDSGGPLYFSYSSPSRAGIRGVVSGTSWDLFQGWSGYATQYQTIANWYLGQAVLSN